MGMTSKQFQGFIRLALELIDRALSKTPDNEDLQKLNGVGQKKAEQIIAYRDQNGGFKQIEDLTKVTGIGEKTFEKLKDQLSLKFLYSRILFIT